MFDDDQETPNTLNCAFEFNDGGKLRMMEFEVRHWMTNNEAGIGEAATRRSEHDRQHVLRQRRLHGHRRLRHL